MDTALNRIGKNGGITMYCPSCGSRVSDGAKFCEKCGTPIAGTVVKEAADSAQTVNWDAQLSETARRAVEKLELSEVQKGAAVFAAISAVSALICLSGSIYSWITAIAALCLTYLCAKKCDFQSKLMAIAYSAFILRFLLIDLRTIFESDYVIHYGVFALFIRFVLYVSTVMYWLMIFEKLEKKELGSSILLGSNCLIAIYNFCEIFVDMKYGFRSVMFDLSWLSFVLVFAILVFFDGKTIPYIKSVFSEKTASEPKP